MGKVGISKEFLGIPKKLEIIFARADAGRINILDIDVGTYGILVSPHSQIFCMN